MKPDQFRLVAPPLTPFHSDGQLNLSAVEGQARLLVDTEVDGVFVAGSTGEFASLAMPERMELASRWMQVATGAELEVIIHVGDNCQANAKVLASHAQQIGADAVAACAPSYFKPLDVDSLINYLAPIATAAADLPFYFYEIPGTTGVRLPMVEFLQKAKSRIPNLVGLKYSNTDLMQMQECLDLGDGEFEVLFGSDEVLLSAVALGVHGAIGSTYNFAAPLYRRMLAAFLAGNFEAAKQAQLQSVKVIRCMMRFGFMAACKQAMSLFGIECGPVRAPLPNLSDAQRDILFQELEQLGIRELAKSGTGTAPRFSAATYRTEVV